MTKLSKVNNMLIYKYGDLVIDTCSYTVMLSGKVIHLCPKEFEVLCLLVQHPGWVYTKEEIYEIVYDSSILVDIDNIIFCLIYSLRKKLELPSKKFKYIKTVRGVGYKFIEDMPNRV